MFNTNIKVFILYAFIMQLIIFIPHNIGFTMSSKKHPKSPNLYFYTRKDISRFLKRIGYPDLAERVIIPHDITRNSDGTALRFFDWNNLYKSKGIVVKCDGSIQELNIPGRTAWFNDENVAVAWEKDDVVYYKNGETSIPPFGFWDADLGGDYFIKGGSPVKIFSITNPKVPLAEANLLGGGLLRIFLKGEKIYLFDLASDIKIDNKFTLKGYIFKRNEASLTLLREIIIPFPEKKSDRYSVEDFSPWSDIILIYQAHDWPRRSKWYEFNLETSEMKYIGKATAWGFYLKCNILESVK